MIDLGRASDGRLRLPAQQVGHAQTAEAKRPDLEELAPADAIAIALLRAPKRQHGKILGTGGIGQAGWLRQGTHGNAEGIGSVGCAGSE